MEENVDTSSIEETNEESHDTSSTEKPNQPGFSKKKKLIIGGVAGATAVGVGIAAPFAIIPVLGYAGFTSAGVAASSFATSVQTASTVAGSWFALCQSAGAVGAVAATTSAGVGVTAGAAAGGIAGGVTAGISRLFSRKPPDNSKTNTDDSPGSSQAESTTQLSKEGTAVPPEESATSYLDETENLIEQVQEESQNNNRQASNALKSLL